MHLLHSLKTDQNEKAKRKNKQGENDGFNVILALG